MDTKKIIEELDALTDAMDEGPGVGPALRLEAVALSPEFRAAIARLSAALRDATEPADDDMQIVKLVLIGHRH